MKGLVVKKNAGLFDVAVGEQVISVKALGSVKKTGIYVGDEVEVNQVITKIYPRKNSLIRPPLANIDNLFIVISPIPKPDLVLVDKLIIYAITAGIKPFIVLNKSDIFDEKFENEIKKIYNKVVPIITCSAENGQIDQLLSKITGISAFAGQSAVGKSSLINALTKQSQAEVGELSKKVDRGKQTTRITSLYKVGQGYIADTAGFSLLNAVVLPVDKFELSRYYPDFIKFIKDCKFRSCTHENGNDCAVIKAVKSGKIDAVRYQNYLKILNEIKESR